MTKSNFMDSPHFVAMCDRYDVDADSRISVARALNQGRDALNLASPLTGKLSILEARALMRACWRAYRLGRLVSKWGRVRPYERTISWSETAWADKGEVPEGYLYTRESGLVPGHIME